jgi:tetratricopeptide (TPR) repeat protein
VTVELSMEEAIALATRLLVEGKTARAESVVRALEQHAPDDPQVLFLAAQIDLQQAEYASAVRILRRLLSSNPEVVRVRLELARALFLARDYEAARYHFDLVLGQDLPDAVRQNVYRYLTAIEAETTWLSLSVYVGPDSNPTSATSAQTIDILGQTFELNPDARAKKAVGLVAFAQARWAFGPENRAFVRGNVELREFPDSHADYAYLQSTLGQNLVSGNTVWTMEAGPLGALYQGRALYAGGLVRLSHASPVTPRLLSSQSVSVRRLDYYDDFEYLSAEQGWIGGDLRYAIDPTSGISAGLQLIRSRAQESAYSYSTLEFSAVYNKELRRRFNASVRVAASRTEYDGELALFEKVRADTLFAVDVNLVARDWSVHGFAPLLAVGASWNDSTIALFEYTRQYLGVGFTRNF